MPNTLISDTLVDFLLETALEEVLKLPAYREHTPETCRMFLDASRRVAREVLFPAYETLDKEPPHFQHGKVELHPKFRSLYRPMIELGLLSATRGEDVGGAQLPMTVAAVATAYLMAANLGVYAIAGLSSGAARLIESFGSEQVKELFMRRMYSGEWAGTMALTEPQAGSSLSDVATKAVPAGGGTYKIFGTKIFISGGEQDLTENIVHLTLARIEGAPPGIKGVSLFAIPKLRPEGSRLVPNDVACTSVFKKIGWKALPSVQLSFGDSGECVGWLVGKPHHGIQQMFQMMNEARLMVGLNSIASASVAYQEALNYAQERPQGRPIGAKDPAARQVPIIEHADVRRMLLRQKAIVEGGLGLLVRCAVLTDRAEHEPDPEPKKEAQLLLDLLIPIAKTFPAEYGFAANTLAIQIFGGYGYTSEYLPEAWWRDQKLNTIHEGTSGIQALDLLGRKAVAAAGEPLRIFAAQVEKTAENARKLGLDGAAVEAQVESLLAVTMELGLKGMSGDAAGMLLHASDYLDVFSIVTIAWELLDQAAKALEKGQTDFSRGKVAAFEYWVRTDLTRAPAILERIRSGERSFADMRVEQF